MDRLLKPKEFDTDHNAPDATKKWKYFFKTFQNFLASVESEDDKKLELLTNHISHDVYTIIENCLTYEQAVTALKKAYVKPVNTVYARHLLAIRRQQDGDFRLIFTVLECPQQGLQIQCGNSRSTQR